MDADAPRVGQRFCLLHESQATGVMGNVLFVHAFAEEMNKSRRMAYLQSQALAKAGFQVVQLDLHGCGDSSGDFGDASWQGWVDDIVQVAHWLQSRTQAPLWLWGHRAGCLLAVEAARQAGLDCHFLFWSAPASGKAMLQQFLRLKTAGQMLAGDAATGGTELLRKQLTSGNSVEIAGYTMTPALALGLEQATMTPPPSQGRRLEWIDLSAREGADLSPVSSKTCAAWSGAGYGVRCHVVQGPSFWQTVEIEDVPALVASTTAAIAASPVEPAP